MPTGNKTPLQEIWMLEIGLLASSKAEALQQVLNNVPASPTEDNQVNGIQIILHNREGRRQRRTYSHNWLYQGNITPPEDEEYDDDTNAT